ncbi:Peptidase, M20/M25/M40 family protein [Minicystis rosea]|nr:Peptidase, M20/M25/M40 family protein [Minicystis rosea]
MTPLSPRVRALAAIAALVLAAIVGHIWARPPAPVPASAPANEFSSARALAELAEIARRPHRIGSAEHARVRAHLVERLRALGLQVEVQEAVVARSRRDETRFAIVRNIVAEKPGTGGGKALLLVAHYDTRSMTPGASDDGYGVSALLETLRALGAGPPLSRPLMVLFTDGEEEGLLGARSFVRGHPRAGEVGLVLNFEARGNAGPALMFQTSNDSGALIRTLGAAMPAPAANSLSQAIYRRMPNDTDLSEWLPRTPALNIANIGGFERYHAPTDTLENVDQGTLQHHGAYALSLARAFGSAELPPPAEPDPIFFNAGPAFVRYPGTWTMPLAGVAAGLLVIFLALGTVRKALHPGRALLAVITVVVVVVLSAVIAAVLWLVVESVRPDYALINAVRPVVKDMYLAAFVAVAFTLALGAQSISAHRLRPAELFAGAATLFCALALVTATILPGGAFLFTWPAIFALVLAIVLLFAGGFESDAPIAVLLQIAIPIPAFVLVSPFVTQLWAAFGPVLALAPAAVAAQLAVIALPALRHVHVPGARTHVATLSVAVALTLAAGVLPPFDAAHPRPDTLFFAIDGDTGRSSWVSPDRAPDGWSSNVLAHAAQRTGVPLPFPLGETQSLLVSEVGKVSEPAPEIRWSDDGLHARIVPPAGAEILAVSADNARFVRVAGETTSGTSFRFYAPPANGVDVELRRLDKGPVTLRVVSQRPGFPDAASPHPGARPPGFMAKPGMMPPWDDLLESDMTLVAKTSTH